jgi:hypothetical protein
MLFLYHLVGLKEYDVNSNGDCYITMSKIDYNMTLNDLFEKENIKNVLKNYEISKNELINTLNHCYPSLLLNEQLNLNHSLSTFLINFKIFEDDEKIIIKTGIYNNYYNGKQLAHKWTKTSDIEFDLFMCLNTEYVDLETVKEITAAI